MSASKSGAPSRRSLQQAIGTEVVERYENALGALRPQEQEAIIGRVEYGLHIPGTGGRPGQAERRGGPEGSGARAAPSGGGDGPRNVKNEPEPLGATARAILDGAPVDWALAETGADPATGVPSGSCGRSRTRRRSPPGSGRAGILEPPSDSRVYRPRRIRRRLSRQGFAARSRRRAQTPAGA